MRQYPRETGEREKKKRRNEMGKEWKKGGRQKKRRGSHLGRSQTKRGGQALPIWVCCDMKMNCLMQPRQRIPRISRATLGAKQSGHGTATPSEPLPVRAEHWKEEEEGNRRPC